MKTLLCSFAFALLASAQMPPPPGGPWCLDNCGAYSGDCTQCHIVQGPAVYLAEFVSVCKDCSGNIQQGALRPRVPMQGDPVATLWAWVKNLAGKQDPKYARLSAMTPERHVDLMRRAVRLRLDGPFLGACSHAFRVGTLERLPGEITATRLRLDIARYSAFMAR